MNTNSLFTKPYVRQNLLFIKSTCFGQMGKILEKRKKPEWVINKERNIEKKTIGRLWLYGLHAVAGALKNKIRIKHKLVITPNAYKKIKDEILISSIKPEIVDPRKFLPPIEKGAVHQGVALEVSPLNWGSLSEVCAPQSKHQLVLLLDRVTDPQNVGAILRSAEVFGALAVVAPKKYSVPETGALAKAASGTLERLPYLRVPNLARALGSLKQMGYFCIGLDGTSTINMVEGLKGIPRGPIALIVGAEGPGLRDLTLKKCDEVLKISSHSTFGSLNVSNAAAISLFTARNFINTWDLMK